MADTRTIVEKADVAIANLINADTGSGHYGGGGGYLNAEQANAFIRMIQEQPTILNVCRVVPMNAPKRKIEKIGFGSRILRAAPNSINDVYNDQSRVLTTADRARPSFGMLELDTVEIMAEVHLPYEVLEDNIERGGLEDTIMSMITERAAIDLEELIIMGDTGSNDEYLKLVDGVLLLADQHVLDLGGYHDITKTIFKKTIQLMPNKYLRNKAGMGFFVSPHVDLEFQDSLADRQTILGDTKVTRREPNYAYGVPLNPVALMPNDKLLFTFPQNIIFGVQRQILIETDKDIRARELIIVLTLRCDVKIEESDATVLGFGFSDTGFGYTTTDTITI